MSGVGLLLLGIGVADLIAGGLSGEIRSRSQALLGGSGAVLVVLAGGWLAGVGTGPTFVLAAATAIAVGTWLGLRSNPAWAMVGLGVPILAVLIAGGHWHAGSGSGLAGWLTTLPYSTLQALESGRFLAGLGAAAFLLSTSNGIVRSVLTVAGTRIDRSQRRLRGGRYIGAIERLLIFGLTLTGEPTAAAVVVAAKSLLRFPELTRAARVETEEAGGETGIAEVDIVTEYFLLGSLVSWALALTAAALCRI